MRHGKTYRINLVDGTAIEGVLRFSWGWSSYRLDDCLFSNREGETTAADGYFMVRKRGILHIQAVSD